jgi:cell division transport system permease protein
MSAEGVRSTRRILPRDKGAAPLDVVIGVMAFLAALALGASLLAERAATGWRLGLADRMTVQILVAGNGDPRSALERETEAALAVLRHTPGIVHAAALAPEQIQALVEPWLGKSAFVDDLPLPRLIDVKIEPGAAIDVGALASELKRAAPDAKLDDHSRWISRLRGLAETLILSAYGVLALIAVATAATVTFATRAGLDAHHELVELLHQMGAHSRFIARAFERHYFMAAIISSAVGAGLAALLFVSAGALEFVGIEAVPFLPPLALRVTELPWLALVPVMTGLISFVTARFSVIAALRGIY